MFTKSARFYDAIYSFKDYAAESEKLHALIQQHKRSDGNRLLDIACGTGAHIRYLQEYYTVEGLDLDEEMLAIARERFPGVAFHHGDMGDFDLGRRFDVVTCLFSSIGYVKTAPRMRRAIANFCRHVKPGGLVVVEPWLTPEFFRVGGVHSQFVDQPDLKIARMNLSTIEDGVSILDFHYLVGTPDGIAYFQERHELGLFTNEEYTAAFRDRGLEVTYDFPGLMSRGLFIGLRVD